jgi:hypothetical protein
MPLIGEQIREPLRPYLLGNYEDLAKRVFQDIVAFRKQVGLNGCCLEATEKGF